MFIVLESIDYEQFESFSGLYNDIEDAYAQALEIQRYSYKNASYKVEHKDGSTFFTYSDQTIEIRPVEAE